jgi:hypothetical protein
MNNPKSVSEESNLHLVLLNKGIQEGRRLEAERIEKIVDSFKCSKCEVSYDGHCPCQRDKRKMLVAIQSRNEGSEKK